MYAPTTPTTIHRATLEQTLKRSREFTWAVRRSVWKLVCPLVLAIAIYPRLYVIHRVLEKTVSVVSEC